MNNVTNLVINRRARWSCACFSLYPDFLLIVYSLYSDIVLIILGTWTDGWLNVGTKQRPDRPPDRHVPAFSDTFQYLQPKKSGPCVRVTRLSIASAVTYADAYSVSSKVLVQTCHCCTMVFSGKFAATVFWSWTSLTRICSWTESSSLKSSSSLPTKLDKVQAHLQFDRRGRNGAAAEERQQMKEHRQKERGGEGQRYKGVRTWAEEGKVGHKIIDPRRARVTSL